jgi:hypothetical protein
LRLVSGRGVSVIGAAPARRLRFSDQATHSTLTIRLRSPAARLRVTLAAPGLAAPTGRVPDAAASRRHKRLLGLSVVDTTNGTSRLVAKVRAGG